MNDDARAETIRYHRAFYAEKALYAPGTWLHRPAPYVMGALEYVRGDALRVLDLGAGVGRHAIAIARSSARVAEVVAVDFLEEALSELERNARQHGVEDRIRTELCDVETYQIERGAFDLVISCSCIEHVSSFDAMVDLLGRIAAGTKREGVNCFMVHTEAEELFADGRRRPALVEFSMSEADFNWAVDSVYGGWKVVDCSTKHWSVMESREGEPFELRGKCVQFTAVKAGGVSEKGA